MKIRSQILPLAALAAGLVGWNSLPVIAQNQTGPSVSVLRTPIDGDETAAPLDPKDYPQGMLFPYSLLDNALAGNVDRSGNADYSKLQDNKYLSLFIQAIEHADLSQFPVFDVYVTDEKTGRESKTVKDHSPELVFWINAYNAFVLNDIAKAYPIKTIDEIKDFDSAKTHNVAGKNYSLKELREKIASFGDPRAMFALPSGTAGGFLPSPTAVRWSEFDARMNSAVQVFVNDPRNVRINRIQGKVTLNPVFKEVDEFFRSKHSRDKGEGIRKALAGYTNQGSNRSYFITSKYRIEYGQENRFINDMRNDPTNAGVEIKR